MTSTPGINSLDIAIDATQTRTQKFLHFNLSKDLEALVKVEDTAEVLHISRSEILPIPQMPKCVLGIYNWRDEMLWNVALNNLLGLPPTNLPNLDSKIAVIVAVIDSQYLGLVVDRVNDIEWHDLATIQPPKTQLFSAQLLPFMQGYLSDSGTILLNPSAIAHSLLIEQYKF